MLNYTSISVQFSGHSREFMLRVVRNFFKPTLLWWKDGNNEQPLYIQKDLKKNVRTEINRKKEKNNWFRGKENTFEIIFSYLHKSFIRWKTENKINIIYNTSSSAPLRCVGRLRCQGTTTNIDSPFNRKKHI